MLGGSEQNTKGILAACLGKVLVIDEAYGLYGGGSNHGSTSDPFKTAVVDTIVAEVQSVPGDDRCVLLLGYKEQLETMFQNVNPGLSRRFPIASGFEFQDFDDDELRRILDMKLGQQGYKATGQARDVAMEMLGRARNRPNFGNAGEIDIKKCRWAYKMQREIARRISVYRGEVAVGHPPFAADSKAACIETSEPLPRDVANIEYTPEDDAVIDQWLREHVMTTWHSLGTCKMRPRDKMGVVDPSLNVYGAEALKVADLSIAPSNIGAHTANTAMVIGEKAADIIIRELGLAQ